MTTEKAPAIEIGMLVAYYKNGWRYGRLLATTAKFGAHQAPAVAARPFGSNWMASWKPNDVPPL
jgi:hypothetical protein